MLKKVSYKCLKGIVQRKLRVVELYIIQFVFFKLVIASFQKRKFCYCQPKISKKRFRFI
jgi:hypothetical protein